MSHASQIVRVFTPLLRGAILALAVTTLAAQTAPLSSSPPPPLTGKIVDFDGKTLTVSTPQAGRVPLTLAPKVQIITQKKVAPSAIKSGLFIGVTASPGADGKLHASEVHIFPESMRGTGEGHYPWQGSPNTTMTNGNVAAASPTTMTNGNVAQTAAAKGSAVTLRVNYKGGENEIQVDPQTPVVLMLPADKSALKPGTPLLAFVTKNADDSATAQMIALNPGAASK